MSDLISREEALSHPFANGKYDKENTNLDFILGFESYKEWLETLPSADILDHARAIKEYCKDRTNKPIWCNDCPLYEAFCEINTPPNMWDLPEGEKGGNDDNT